MAPDSKVFVKQNDDGCCGGNRREVVVAGEEYGSSNQVIRERRGVFRVRILVQDGLVESDSINGVIGVKKPPQSTPLDRESLLKSVDESLSKSRVFRLGLAALSMPLPNSIVEGFNGPSPTKPLSIGDRFEYAVKGDDSAAQNTAHMLSSGICSAEAAAREKYLSHERLKLQHGPAILDSLRREMVKGEGMAYHPPEERKSMLKSAKRAYRRVNPASIEGATPKCVGNTSAQFSSAASQKTNDYSPCNLCAPMPLSYDGVQVRFDAPIRRYGPADLCKVLHESSSKRDDADLKAPPTIPKEDPLPLDPNSKKSTGEFSWVHKPKAPVQGRELCISDMDKLLSAQDEVMGLKALVDQASHYSKMLRKSFSKQ